jgi:hypothetical protein
MDCICIPGRAYNLYSAGPSEWAKFPAHVALLLFSLAAAHGSSCSSEPRTGISHPSIVLGCSRTYERVCTAMRLCAATE